MPRIRKIRTAVASRLTCAKGETFTNFVNVDKEGIKTKWLCLNVSVSKFKKRSFTYSLRQKSSQWALKQMQSLVSTFGLKSI